ncbi:hypothetical protein NDN08_005552 [Rhodosorus marinus]|uniref:Rieske domain-containing protein n=1 Tax=Rhodosorus marinus TaxID=101924 RepID=A0AAV8V401_9RHOD|nr:hypothetical protein NDN08_005552 [Rhodosorus marinus]
MGFVSGGFMYGKVRGVDRAVCGRSAVRAMAEEWTPVGTVEELNAEGGKKVVKIDSGKVLIKEFAGDVFAMSNSCPHLNLPLEGKILKADYTSTGSIVCSAHKTAFNMKTGDVVGEWCPGMPKLPFVGKMKEENPLKVYPTKVEDGSIFVNVA